MINIEKYGLQRTSNYLSNNIYFQKTSILFREQGCLLLIESPYMMGAKLRYAQCT